MLMVVVSRLAAEEIESLEKMREEREVRIGDLMGR